MNTHPKWANGGTINFKSNQATVVSNHPVKFHVDQTKRLSVGVQKPNISDEDTPKMGKRWDPSFKSNHALVMFYHLVRFQIDRTKCLELETKMLTDGDPNTSKVGYNCNPPNSGKSYTEHVAELCSFSIVP